MSNTTADYETTTDSSPKFGPPSLMDIILPPIVVTAIIVFGLLALSIGNFISCRRKQRRINIEPMRSGPTQLFTQSYNIRRLDSIESTKIRSEEYISILNREDWHVIEKFETYQNNPRDLMIITIPCVVSLLFCPITILVYQPLIDFFWPKDMTGGMPNINDVVSAFLMPAGLVYAIAFGFAFQDALAKRDNTSQFLENQITLLRQIWGMVNCCSIISNELKIRVGKILKDVMISWMAELIGIETFLAKGTLWDIIKCLQKVNRQSKDMDTEADTGGTYDDNILDSLLSHILQLEAGINNRCYKGWRSIHFLQWAFLECLGFITFFGVVMIKAESYRLELTMCLLTVFSISSFSYILADLDSTYHGAFKVCLKPYLAFTNTLNSDCAKIANYWSKVKVADCEKINM